MKVALAQTHIVWEDKEQNYKRAEELIREAAKEHRADLIIFPEMSFTGFSMNTKETREAAEESGRRMKALAREWGIIIGYGWAKDAGDKSENHYTLIGKDGEVLSDFIKMHPFSYAREDEFFTKGEDLVFYDLCGIPASTLICYDLRFPEVFEIASRSAHLFIVPANWPEKRITHWTTLLQARAIENQVYMLGVNCVGQIGKLYYSGESCVVNPYGEILGQLSKEEGLLVVEIEDDAVDYRGQIPIKSDRREDLYQRLSIETPLYQREY